MCHLGIQIAKSLRTLDYINQKSVLVVIPKSLLLVKPIEFQDLTYSGIATCLTD